MKTKVLNLDNKSAGDVELNDAIFGLEPRADLIQRVVVWQLAKRRSGQHKVLTRAEGPPDPGRLQEERRVQGGCA